MAPALTSGETTAWPAASILVVDDDPTILRLVGLVLGEAGYVVRTARDGREALAQVAAAVPALVLTDRMMPLLDGRGVLAALRADPVTRQVPVIVMSAVPVPAFGANGTLGKPFDLDGLVALVARLLATSPRAG